MAFAISSRYQENHRAEIIFRQEHRLSPSQSHFCGCTSAAKPPCSLASFEPASQFDSSSKHCGCGNSRRGRHSPFETIVVDGIEIIDMSVLTLELLKACPYFNLHSLEVIHEIGDFGWREVVPEYRLHKRQRFFIDRQSDRL